MTTNRSIKTGMATLALVAAVAIGGAALSPILVKAEAQDKTFSHSFRMVRADQVLSWMGKQGIEVQVQQSDLPNRLLTFAFDGMGQDELVKTFGSMVGMRAEKRGDVYSLLKGVGGDGQSEPLGSEDTRGPMDCQERGIIGMGFACPEGLEFMPGELEMIELELDELGQDFDFDFDFEMPELAQDPGALVEEIMKALEEAGAFSGKKMTESEKQALKERLHERLSKAHGRHLFMGPEGFQFKMLEPGQFYKFDPEHMKGLNEQQRKEIEEAHKAMQKAMEEAHRAGAFKLDRAEFEKMQEEMQKLHKEGAFKFTPEQIEKMKAEGFYKVDKAELERMQKEMGKLHKEGAFKFTPEQIEKMKAEGHFFDQEAFKKHMEEMHKHLGENLKVMQLKLENLKKFMSSLTPAQKELAKKQGHLRPEDLTKEQRDLLGIDGKGDVDFTFQNNGEKITIKGKGTGQTTGTARKGVITI